MKSEIKAYNQIQEKKFNEILPKLCQKSLIVKKVETEEVIEKYNSYNDLITLIFVSGKKQLVKLY
jgi:hypothetical protein